MNRPTTTRGLLWRLAKHYPKSSLVVALGVAMLVSVVASRPTRDHTRAERCPLEQTWFQGDVHFSQQLELGHDGRGVWWTGGMDHDAPRLRAEFRWQSDGSTLTVVVGPARRTVGYRIEVWDHISDGLCFLRLDGDFLPDMPTATHYTNRR
jgi:hypothetical protein